MFFKAVTSPEIGGHLGSDLHGKSCENLSFTFGRELLGFCNLKTNETNASEVDDLNAHIAALTSEIELLDGSISSAENEFSEIANAHAEATNIRDRRIQFSCS